MQKTLVALVLSLMIALAGCLASEDEPDPDLDGDDPEPQTDQDDNNTVEQRHTGGWLVTTPVYCGLVGDVLTPLSGILTQGIALDPATVGLSFSANFTSDVETAVLGYAVHFTNAEGEFTVVESFFGAPGESITGKVSEGADGIYFEGCGASGEVSVEYVAR